MTFETSHVSAATALQSTCQLITKKGAVSTERTAWLLGIISITIITLITQQGEGPGLNHVF